MSVLSGSALILSQLHFDSGRKILGYLFLTIGMISAFCDATRSAH